MLVTEQYSDSFNNGGTKQEKTKQNKSRENKTRQDNGAKFTQQIFQLATKNWA